MKDWFKILLNYCANLLFVAVFFGFCVNETLPDISSAQTMKRSVYIKIFDSSDHLLAQYGHIQEASVDAKYLPKHLIHAIIDVEDKSFFSHFGIDVFAIIRSFFKNLLSNRIVAGGSSITQQLAKNILQNEEKVSVYDKTLLRKVKELFLAIKLERRYSKYEILSFYLNRIYFGGACYGVYSASILYFNKKPEELTLYEAAAVVGLVQAPSRFAGNKDFWRLRTKHVLKRMYKNKHISKVNFESFDNLNFVIRKNLSLFGHFSDYIIAQVPEHLKNRDLIIKSTLDSAMHTNAHSALKRAWSEIGQKWNADQGAMVVLDKTGAIKAMVGSLDYQKAQFNIAAHAKRSTGSFFKYYVYLEAMRQGINPDSLISDQQISIGAWSPSNYLHKSVGKVKIKDAFAQSVNSAAVMLLIGCGIKNVISMVHQLGIKEHISPNPSIALGGMNTSLLESAATMIPVINAGYKVEPYCIKEIYDARTGELLYKHQVHYQKILDARTVWYVWQLLRYTVTNGTARSINLPGKIAGAKTGTSNDYRDVLLIGATSDYVFGSWFGRSDFKPMERAGAYPSSLACRYFLEQLPDNAEIEFDSDFEVNTKTFEDLML